MTETFVRDSGSWRWRAGAAWVGRRALWVIFALVLLIPKLNRLRRRRALWNFGRAVIALGGAAAMAMGLHRGIRSGPVAVAVVMLLFALLAVPERQGISIDARRRELGALVVVDGGLFTGADGKQRRAKLFVAGDRLLVVNEDLRVLLELPYHKCRAQSAEASGSGWRLRIECDDQQAEFTYEGVFAEHFARVAGATIQSRLQRELPVLR
ncbi:MAG TPA: hypothetical protein VFB23_12275 [Candidatus Acidoferrales bacterium]|nr:hypothetical protein [Candidatus Acidoferrales bacterium]